MSERHAFFDMKAELFPFTIEYIQASSGTVIDKAVVEGPGALRVPGLGDKYGEIAVRITDGLGNVQTGYMKRDDAEEH